MWEVSIVFPDRTVSKLLLLVSVVPVPEEALPCIPAPVESVDVEFAFLFVPHAATLKVIAAITIKLFKNFIDKV